MKNNKNLYKLDDVFIVISYLLILPLLYIFKPILSYIIYDAENAQEVLLQFVQSQKVIISILLGSIVFLQILGRLIRKEEKILVKILDIVVMYKTISINQLQHNLDMSQPKIEKYIKKLSNIGRLNIQFDGTYVKLEMAAQSVPSPNSFQKETNSTNTIYSTSTEQVSSSNLQQKESTSPDAIHQVSPITSNTISSKEDLQNILIKLQGAPKGKQTSGKKFNVVLFIVLFFAFWPIAFIYAANYYMKSQKGNVIEERLKNRLKDM